MGKRKHPADRWVGRMLLGAVVLGAVVLSAGVGCIATRAATARPEMLRAVVQLPATSATILPTVPAPARN